MFGTIALVLSAVLLGILLIGFLASLYSEAQAYRATVLLLEGARRDHAAVLQDRIQRENDWAHAWSKQRKRADDLATKLRDTEQRLEEEKKQKDEAIAYGNAIFEESNDRGDDLHKLIDERDELAAKLETKKNLLIKARCEIDEFHRQHEEEHLPKIAALEEQVNVLSAELTETEELLDSYRRQLDQWINGVTGLLSEYYTPGSLINQDYQRRKRAERDDV